MREFADYAGISLGALQRRLNRSGDLGSFGDQVEAYVEAARASGSRGRYLSGDEVGLALELVEGQSFKGEPVRLDGMIYVECSFDNCVFEYAGTAPFAFDGVTHMEGDNRLNFVEAAHNALEALRYLHGVGMIPSVEAFIGVGSDTRV